MNRLSLQNIRRGIVLAAVAALATSCRTVTDAWMSGWTESSANDRIMLVRKEPVTLGYDRLRLQSAVYPDLGIFLSHHGHPDFLAESNVSNRHFLILYYLRQREAFSCRTKAPQTRAVEFSGPQPITEREYVLLTGLKNGKAPPRAAAR